MYQLLNEVNKPNTNRNEVRRNRR